MTYAWYQQFCLTVSDLQGNKLPTNLNEQEIKQWEAAIKQLQWSDR